jgi:hypothetical protein
VGLQGMGGMIWVPNSIAAVHNPSVSRVSGVLFLLSLVYHIRACMLV